MVLVAAILLLVAVGIQFRTCCCALGTRFRCVFSRCSSSSSSSGSINSMMFFAEPLVMAANISARIANKIEIKIFTDPPG